MKLRLPFPTRDSDEKARKRREVLNAHLDGKCSETCPHCAKGEK